MMKNISNVRSLRKVVRKMAPGETLYIDAINLSTGAIDQLRSYVKDQILLPVEAEIMPLYNNIPAVMSGKVILPQMTYIKQ